MGRHFRLQSTYLLLVGTRSIPQRHVPDCSTVLYNVDFLLDIIFSLLNVPGSVRGDIARLPASMEYVRTELLYAYA
jgi:hypothetical protein